MTSISKREMQLANEVAEAIRAGKELPEELLTKLERERLKEERRLKKEADKDIEEREL